MYESECHESGDRGENERLRDRNGTLGAFTGRKNFHDDGDGAERVRANSHEPGCLVPNFRH